MIRGTFISCGFLCLFLACSSSSSPTGSGAAVDAGAKSDASAADASDSADAALGALCTFNSDCPASQRCECSETAGCDCEDGARGTGKNGIDTCTTGDDCESSLCVEGPSTESYCSGPCTDASGCTGSLPTCDAIAGIGMICVRKP